MTGEKASKKALFLLLFLVLGVRIAYLAVFHDRVFLGPSTQYDQAFVAIHLLEGKGVRTYKEPPAVVESADPSRLIDPERYAPPSEETVPYIKEVTGYAGFLALVWKIAGAKLWIYPQTVQALFEMLVALGLYLLTLKSFGRRAAFWTGLGFALLVFEARSSVVPYKDIFLLYIMLGIAFPSRLLFLRRRRPLLLFAVIAMLAGAGFYFMPSIALYPFFLAIVLVFARRVDLKTGAVCLLVAAFVMGLAVYPYQAYVRAHRGEPGVQEPLFWYRFWLGTKVESFASTQEERFQDYFREKLPATGLTLEQFCKREFLAEVKANPPKYAVRTVKKFFSGMFLVYANAGDCTMGTSWARFKTVNPKAGFMDYVKVHPARVLGMGLGTLSVSVLFPLALVAAAILVRRKRGAEALLFLHVPLYFLLLHMFFHYEARYLLGALPGSLPLIGFLLGDVLLIPRIREKKSLHGFRNHFGGRP